MGMQGLCIPHMKVILPLLPSSQVLCQEAVKSGCHAAACSALDLLFHSMTSAQAEAGEEGQGQGVTEASEADVLRVHLKCLQVLASQQQQQEAEGSRATDTSAAAGPAGPGGKGSKGTSHHDKVSRLYNTASRRCVCMGRCFGARTCKRCLPSTNACSDSSL